MHRLLCGVLAGILSVLLVACDDELASSGSSAQSVARAQANRVKQLTAVLRDIHDKESAERAAPAIHRICADMAVIGRQMERIQRQRGALVVGHNADVRKELEQQFQKQQERLQKMPEVRRIVENAFRQAEIGDAQEAAQAARHRVPADAPDAPEARVRPRDRTQPDARAQKLAQVTVLVARARAAATDIQISLTDAKDEASARVAAPKAKEAVDRFNEIDEKLKADMTDDLKPKFEQDADRLNETMGEVKREYDRIAGKPELAEPMKEVLPLLKKLLGE